MDFGLTPADHIAIVAGIVVPAVGAIVATTVAVVRHIFGKSRMLDRALNRLDNLEGELARERDAARTIHRELYDRLRHVDTSVAALAAKIDLLLKRSPTYK